MAPPEAAPPPSDSARLQVHRLFRHARWLGDLGTVSGGLKLGSGAGQAGGGRLFAELGLVLAEPQVDVADSEAG